MSLGISKSYVTERRPNGFSIYLWDLSGEAIHRLVQESVALGAQIEREKKDIREVRVSSVFNHPRNQFEVGVDVKVGHRLKPTTSSEP